MQGGLVASEVKPHRSGGKETGEGPAKKITDSQGRRRFLGSTSAASFS
jgi:hypothetical protein